MKIENLEIGMELKNWKALCELLGVEPKTSGNAKKSQEKEFKEYFDWTKQGQRIIITEIKTVHCENELSLINSLIKDNDNEKGTVFNESDMICSQLQEEIGIDLKESSLSVYENIVSQIEGNQLKQLIAKSIINQLYLQVSQIGTIGIGGAWWITDKNLYKVTGMVSDSYDWVNANPKRFCNKTPGLNEDNLSEVLDHLGVNKEWLRKQRQRALDYLVNDLHLITHTQNAYYLKMKTTRIKGGKAITNTEDYYPTLDELEWINKEAIPGAMRGHKDENGNKYTSLKQIRCDGKNKEFYQEWLPQYINENLPTGWGQVTEIYKCHRIGFSQKIIEEAALTDMRLLVQEKEILDEIAQSILDDTRKRVTDNRDKQTQKRHEKALKASSDDITTQIRCLDSYIGVGYVVNRECHSTQASYKDYTQKHNSEKTIISKVVED